MVTLCHQRQMIPLRHPKLILAHYLIQPKGHQGPEYLSLQKRASLILIYQWVPIDHFHLFPPILLDMYFSTRDFNTVSELKMKFRQLIALAKMKHSQCHRLGHVTGVEFTKQKPFAVSKSCVTNLTIHLTNFFCQVVFPMTISTSYYESKFINIKKVHFS